MRKMLMYLFWIYIVLKVKQIADYDRGITKKQLLVSVEAAYITWIGTPQDEVEIEIRDLFCQVPPLRNCP